MLGNKYQDAWSHHNYFAYIVEGRRIWHTAHGSYDLRKGNCVFVRKGACIVEEFLEKESCFIFFFMPDDFICRSLQSKARPVHTTKRQFDPIISVDDNSLVQAFFTHMMQYFDSNREPDETLLELKFKELVLTLADDTGNNDLRAYFCSLLQQPQSLILQEVMENNFCFNLRLEDFAKLCARSLSAFKRDFESVYQTSPGKWILEKRLSHSLHLLTNLGKTVSEAAFESGFENPSHFSRAFKQRFGNSPAALKQQSLALGS